MKYITFSEKVPFIIQADLLLASSRERILLDSKWNKGILDCVPIAFMNAFISLVKSIEDAPVSSLTSMFKFLPVHSSSYEGLNVARESIKAKIVEESIVPVKKGCALIARHLDQQDEFSTFVRVYNYLSQFKWEPVVRLTERSASERKFGKVLKEDCCMFWLYVSKNWNLETEKSPADALVKVPVYSSPKKREPVRKEEVSLANDAGLQIIPRERLFGKALLRLICGFLAGPPLKWKWRRGGKLSKIWWDRENSKFFIQKTDKSSRQKRTIEFATSYRNAK
ncbi:unnamed protein product [Malus baccata var. baccata]